MQIIEYEEKYLNDVRTLLTELSDYIVSIDKDNLEQTHEEYFEKMALIDLADVKNNNGKCYLALDNNQVIGLIMGIIPPYSEYDYLDYKCPKRGRITELIVSQNIRSKGVGQALMHKMEEGRLQQQKIIDVLKSNVSNKLWKNRTKKTDYF